IPEASTRTFTSPGPGGRTVRSSTTTSSCPVQTAPLIVVLRLPVRRLCKAPLYDALDPDVAHRVQAEFTTACALARLPNAMRSGAPGPTASIHLGLGDGEARFFDLNHQDFVRDLFGSLARIYDFLGMAKTPATRRRKEA